MTHCLRRLAAKFKFVEFHTPSGTQRPVKGPKGCRLTDAVRNALSAATRRQIQVLRTACLLKIYTDGAEKSSSSAPQKPFFRLLLLGDAGKVVLPPGGRETRPLHIEMARYPCYNTPNMQGMGFPSQKARLQYAQDSFCVPWQECMDFENLLEPQRIFGLCPPGFTPPLHHAFCNHFRALI